MLHSTLYVVVHSHCNINVEYNKTVHQIKVGGMICCCDGIYNVYRSLELVKETIRPLT